MRAATIAEILRDEPAAAAVDAIAELIALASGERPGHLLALDALAAVLADDELGYEVRAGLYAAAVEAGMPEVARLLFHVSPPVPGNEDLVRRLGEPRPLVPRGRPLSLGERKSLARGPRSESLKHLLRDPHPDVIAMLLDNPHLTEADVLQIASRRPTLPAVLEMIFACERWRARRHVRRALVLNPFTPVPLAARLMLTATDAELAELGHDGTLAEALRQHASDILVRRASRRAADQPG